MKKCPYCAEEIQDAAIVCKHCGRDLPPSSPAPAPVVTPPARRPWWKHWVPLALLGLLILGGIGALRARVFGPYIDPDDPQSGPSAISLLMQYRDDPHVLDGRRVMIESALVTSVDGGVVILSGGPTSSDRIRAALSWTSSTAGIAAGDVVTMICTVEGLNRQHVVLASGCTKVSR